MTASNLPPGVSVSDIPGNRPEDEWYDKFCDALDVPLSFVPDSNPEDVARAVNIILHTTAYFTARGYADGLSEASMLVRELNEDG